MIERERLFGITDASLNVVSFGIFIALFSLLLSAEFGFWTFGQGRYANAGFAAPCPVVVGVINIVALNQLRVMAG